RGKSIVISGTFSISRDEMKALIEANGGRNSGSISSKTAFLLAGEKPGPEKLRKAESLGVKVIDEAGFRAILESGVGPEMKPETPLEPETKAENRPEEKKVPVQLTLF
ncbi:MAG: BRCT domain-containing protein, partial [Candidatus Cryptobacteroides sp.]|nr:BRCT domain-containing protein [Candidatus Cryptobacteroides sp.]